MSQSLPFTNNAVTRTCKKTYANYNSYRKVLQSDFHHRCAYCDLHDSWVMPLPYQIDHFIPQAVFNKAGRSDLETAYMNLMYACPVCNRAKSDTFSGTIDPVEIVNPLFYNPDNDDMNAHFYRDECGRILSNDDKGKNIIRMLKLYRPTKQLGWYLDQLLEVQSKIKQMADVETDPSKKEKLELAYYKIGNDLFKKSRYFAHSYAKKG